MLREAVETKLAEGNEFVCFHELGLTTLLNAIPLDKPGKIPNSQWLMLCLAAVAGPECKIFQKGYKPDKIKREVRMPRVIDNTDDFFTNCEPVSSGKLPSKPPYRGPRFRSAKLLFRL